MPHSGILLLDKPAGSTSARVLNRIKRLWGRRAGWKKIGHAGSLDPLATGLLLVLVNEGTKLSSFLMDLDKEYIGSCRMGEARDTLDADGAVVGTAPWGHVGEEAMRRAAGELTGTQLQEPPLYSALKRDGKRLYEYARAGEEVSVESRKVVVAGFDITAFAPPRVEFRIKCSRGTYVRSLIDDLAKRLGTLAYVTELRRTRCGPLNVESALDMEGLEEMARSGSVPALIGLSEALAYMPACVLAEPLARDVRQGHQPVEQELWPGGAPPRGPADENYRFIDEEGRLVAVARRGGADGRVALVRVFADA